MDEGVLIFNLKLLIVQIYREITPLKEADVFVLLDNINNGFDYPIHNHPEYELNLVMNMSGTRIVGDNTERYYEYDLVLLGPYLYHKWDGDEDRQESGEDYRVITIQFAPDLFDVQLLQKQPFYKIRKLLEQSARGICFQGQTLTRAIEKLLQIADLEGFGRVLAFLDLLSILSDSKDVKYLASEGFDSASLLKSDSKRLQSAYGYIIRNFTDSSLKIREVAKLLNMSDSAFSHFFRKYTNKSFTQFLIDMRIGYACKLLLDTDDPVSQIAFLSGFNNMTNFNRLFKKYRECTPMAYRQRFKEKNGFDWEHQTTPFQFMPSGAKLEEAVKPREYRTKLQHS